ncbi:MAG: LacI family transcriptional regulator [Bifidobacteriaceae bacterium]|jgi:LacI family transcriptional regulator|nr:LacI family transcriptional regulator [Bifidobacteriaceae bacterium]
MIDVAREAGVSAATVSRVLNGKPVRQDLAEAVHRVVQELGYSPDRTARSLRRRHSAVLALILPDIENPFFTAVARGVEDIAEQAGYSVVICNSDDLPDKESRYIQVAELENMAGLIIAPTNSEPSIDRLIAKGRPVVMIDRTVKQNVDQVTFDNVDLGFRATQALIERGCRRIACVTGPVSASTARDRATGWRAAIADAGLDAPPDYLTHQSFRVEGAHQVIAQLLDLAAPPDAVVAANNLSGVGVLKAITERGIENDFCVSVIGDLPFVTTLLPKVTNVPLNPRGLGVIAARMVLERLTGLDLPPRLVVLRETASSPTRAL